MTGWTRRAMQVPDSHPTARGHFPGRPIVPGALLLDEVAAVLCGPGALRFRAVKFLAPVRHGERLELRWQTREDGLRRFEISRFEISGAELSGAGGQTTVLTGTLEGGA
jgi:3-hydroxyacyl-[acyl-carrier-protein] dehydratase